MIELTIVTNGPAIAECCALCSKRTPSPAGPRLALRAGHKPVCRDCGRRHAPLLAALLELAHVARRVGRIGRHTLVPPMVALLELARAAEQYTDAAPKECRPAA
jgi:hypothetical protein